MIIVQGVFELSPDDCETFIAESLETQQISRAEDGCIEYVFAIDPVVAGRVVLSERWESKAQLDAHIVSLTARRKAEAEAGANPLAPISRTVTFYEASQIKAP